MTGIHHNPYQTCLLASRRSQLLLCLTLLCYSRCLQSMCVIKESNTKQTGISISLGREMTIMQQCIAQGVLFLLEMLASWALHDMCTLHAYSAMFFDAVCSS